MAPSMPGPLAEACEQLRRGNPVLLFDRDDREAETDLFFAAEFATPAAIRELRREAGGLIFMAVDPTVGARLDLPFLQDVFESAIDEFPIFRAARANDIKYDARSSFSLPINHRETFTGITDNDRSLTARSFAILAKESVGWPAEKGREEFGRRFRTPGHVHLCVGAAGLLAERQGHTELGVALARIAGITPVLVGAEMLGEGRALSRDKAQAYAAARGTVHLDGSLVQSTYAAVFPAAQGAAQGRTTLAAATR
ncbi:MAG: 3,4-dihydroxy-2-butanone-4-phosphate synthase [Thermoplasmatota archaeon]